MKLSTRTIALAVCMVMALVGVVSGTVAYLSDTTSVLNTFTVGNVDIKLDETKVNEKGEPVDKNGNPVDWENAIRLEEGNEYHLIPGMTYTKDPTITLMGGSEPSYVRMVVTITDYADLKEAWNGEFDFAQFAELVNRDPETGWNAPEGEEDHWVTPAAGIVNEEEDKITFEFRYSRAVDTLGGDDAQYWSLFNELKIPTWFDGDDLKRLNGEQVDATDNTTKMEILVEGHAIQAASFNSEDEAWEAFGVQYANAGNQGGAEGGNTGSEGGDDFDVDGGEGGID